jgi:hypothetical protein
VDGEGKELLAEKSLQTSKIIILYPYERTPQITAKPVLGRGEDQPTW